MVWLNGWVFVYELSIVGSNPIAGKSKVLSIWNSQKQLPQLLYSCSKKFCNIRKKTPVPKALFNKRYMCLHVDFGEFFKTAHLFPEHI